MRRTANGHKKFNKVSILFEFNALLSVKTQINCIISCFLNKVSTHASSASTASVFPNHFIFCKMTKMTVLGNKCQWSSEWTHFHPDCCNCKIWKRIHSEMILKVLQDLVWLAHHKLNCCCLGCREHRTNLTVPMSQLLCKKEWRLIEMLLAATFLFGYTNRKAYNFHL